MYIQLRALAVNVMAIYAPLRRKRRKHDRMTSVEPLVGRLYTLDELTELRRTTMDCVDKLIHSAHRASFSPQMNHHRRAPRLPDRNESLDSEAVFLKNKLCEPFVLRLHIVAGRG